MEQMADTSGQLRSFVSWMAFALRFNLMDERCVEEVLSEGDERTTRVGLNALGNALDEVDSYPQIRKLVRQEFSVALMFVEGDEVCLLRDAHQLLR